MLIVSLDRDLGSSRLLSCSTVPQNLTSGRHSERLTPKSLILEVNRAREDGTNLYGGILQPGRYVAHPPRSDEDSPRGYCDDRSNYVRYAAFRMAPSGTSPWVT